MTGLHHDLLQDPWITTTDDEGRKELLDLATVLARLGTGEPLEFPNLQSQQRQPWHAFLVQLAALALHRGGEAAVQQDAATWRKLVGGLAEDPAAFHLVVEDLSRPAFFQPPVPEGNLKKFKRSSPSPEILDVLITAKNFDVKADRFSAPAAVEHWAFALITLQTFQGFLGRGNYGIARMNGGFASRPEVALASGLGTGERFVRDLQVLLEAREEMIEAHHFQADGFPLLWTLPWKGEKREALGVEALDPFYLEVCRRVRLAQVDGEVHAFIAPTEGARVEAKEQLGNLGDPWTPIRKKDGAALTVSESGFHYRLVQELLFGSDYERPAALQVRGDDSSSSVAVLRVLARGQGKTGGLHQREIVIPAKVRRRMGRAESRDQLAVESKGRVEKASEVRRQILRPALLSLGQERVDRAAGQRLDYQDDRPGPWLDRFDREVDRIFFESLFQDLDAEIPVEERQERWEKTLFGLAERVFRQAVDSRAPSGVHRYRAIARAESLFYFLCRRDLPGAFLSVEDDGPGAEPPATANPEPTSSEAHP